MTPQIYAQQAYTRTATPTRTPRDTEYDAISKITQRLKAAAARKATDFTGFAQALHENRRLWNVLANVVSDSQNALPNELRARIFYLAEFTEKHSSLVLSKNAVVDPLLEINMAVLRGLRQMRST